MIDSTLTQKFEMIARSANCTLPLAVAENMEKVAREHVTEELFKDAAQLLDPNTVVTDEDEYHRGMVELIMEFTGQSSDDKDGIAQEISSRTGIHRVTELDFAIAGGGDALYIGPLEPAKAYVKQECEWEVTTANSGKSILVNLDGGNCFGVGDTEEMAWRYAIAAELYGNTGETFQPFLLQVWKR